MLDDLRSTLSTDKIRHMGQDAVQDARQRIQHARTELRLARAHGRARLWHLGTDTLTRAHEALGHAPESLAPVIDPLRKAVDEQLDKLTAVGLPDYDTLNARDAAAAVRGLDLVKLERVEHYEITHKNRKTVLEAVARERARRFENHNA